MMPVSVAVAVAALATALSVPVALLGTSADFQRTFHIAHQLCIVGVPLAF
jgi:hypothetical protein